MRHNGAVSHKLSLKKSLKMWYTIKYGGHTLFFPLLTISGFVLNEKLHRNASKLATLFLE